jgi:hypothetical protein
MAPRTCEIQVIDDNGNYAKCGALALYYYHRMIPCCQHHKDLFVEDMRIDEKLFTRIEKFPI